MIGRQQELAAACALLLRPGVRLLTLVGMAGVGKTRLGLAVVEALQEHFANGVCFVSLASVHDPTRVLPAIAQALGLREASALSLENLVRATLRDRHLLLFLDNFEQVIRAAHLLSSFLASCPWLCILVTSRSILHLSAEQEFVVPPLALPDLRRLPEPAVLAQVAAVHLFVLRVQAVQPAFALTATNAGPIAAICVWLDGLPLALELAAARIKVFPPEALLAHLSHRLEILTGGTRDVPTRQQTLRAALQWSYDLLSAAEQRLFRRLAVFVNGCTLEAITLCHLQGDLEGDVIETVASLLDQSMVSNGTGGERTAPAAACNGREVAWERLSSAGSWKPCVMSTPHTIFVWPRPQPLTCLGLNRWHGWTAWSATRRILRAAWDWFQGRREFEAVLRFGAALWPFWWIHGHLSEGYALSESALAAPAPWLEELRAQVHIGAGVLAYEQGRASRHASTVQRGWFWLKSRLRFVPASSPCGC